MTFAERLEELRKAATPGPWQASPKRLVINGQQGPLMSYLYGNRASTEGLCVSLASERIADHEMVAFLVNNADAILELVRAAEEYLGAQRNYAKAALSAEVAADNYSDSEAEMRRLAEAINRVSIAEKRLPDALAKLNGGQA